METKELQKCIRAIGHCLLEIVDETKKPTYNGYDDLCKAMLKAAARIADKALQETLNK